jgi:hypothetical protein
MDLVGQLSSPVGPLKTILDLNRRGVKRATARPVASTPAGASHRRVGWVVEAVERVLAENHQPMQAKAIHEAVEQRLGRAVSWSSVKNALVYGLGGRSPSFERVRPGCYMLIDRSATLR